MELTRKKRGGATLSPHAHPLPALVSATVPRPGLALRWVHPEKSRGGARADRPRRALPRAAAGGRAGSRAELRAVSLRATRRWEPRRENLTAPPCCSPSFCARAPAWMGRCDGGRGGGRRAAATLLSTGRGKPRPGCGRTACASLEEQPRRRGPASPGCQPPPGGGRVLAVTSAPARLPRGVLGGGCHGNAGRPGFGRSEVSLLRRGCGEH